MRLIGYIKKDNNITLVLDFDHTITTFNSDTSIGVFNNILGYKYFSRKRKIDRFVNKTNSKLITKILWYQKIKLLKKYINQINLSEIEDKFIIRKEFITIFNYCKKNNISIIICSSGYKKLIEYVLKKNKIDNYKLMANELNTKFKDIITPKNKYKFIKCNTKVILMGDQIDDKDMIKSLNKKTIGIANKNNYKKLNKYFDEVVVFND